MRVLARMNNGTSNPRFLPARLPRICVPVVGADFAEMVEKAEDIIRDNPFIEFRLDYLSNPEQGVRKIRSFVESHPEVLIIATCRRTAGGGKFRGSAASELDILIKAASYGCHLVDLEIESAVQLKPADLTRLRRAAHLIISAHDFQGAGKLEETFATMKQYPADFFKVVTTAKKLSDNLAMLKFLERHSDEHSLIGICMGEQGLISRVLGVRAGSRFTFGTAGPGEETAPGQISARQLRDIYRIDQVDAATRVYGVAGDPISHSLSPIMLNAAFRRENVNAVYLALHAKTLEDLLACIQKIPIHGISVTMPYKEEVLSYLDKSDPLTSKIGACNTVVRSQEGRLFGFNTDVNGLLGPIEARLRVAGAKVLVLGAGGAARAAVFALKDKGAEVYIFNRTPAPAQSLARKAQAKSIAKADIKKTAFDLIVNATPVGMEGNQDSLPLAAEDFTAKYLFEMVYTPAETPMVRMARARGIQVILGSEMFVQQGARQFEIWTGKPAPIAEMQRVVEYALSQGEAAKARAGAEAKA
jgi:3-dehydroquinate dehydratase / shikimate dehydrogenase